MSRPLTIDTALIGRPRGLYIAVLQLLDDVHSNRAEARQVFIEAVRILLEMRDEQQYRLSSLKESLRRGVGTLPLASEAIVALIQQHLAVGRTSRLPVLIVAAAYRAAGVSLGEWARPLNAHNAADFQTGAIGDVEVCLVGDNNAVTVYEMKDREVSRNDIDVAITKIANRDVKPDNYIFITTEPIHQGVVEYASTVYGEIGGTEIVILDCIGFLRHFLHFFYRRRTDFLEAYQEFMLNEPDSAVSFPVKEAFLALRQAAEADV